jgi:hypothetical protein
MNSKEDERNQIYEKLKELKKALTIKESIRGLSNQKCIYCNKIGCDIISFHKMKPAHSACNNKFWLDKLKK